MSGTLKIVLVVVGLVGLVGYLTYLTMSPNEVTCEVCIEFRGRTECRKATGKNREEAQMTAASTACGLLTSGVGEAFACPNTTPKSVTCQDR